MTEHSIMVAGQGGPERDELVKAVADALDRPAAGCALDVHRSDQGASGVLTVVLLPDGPDPGVVDWMQSALDVPQALTPTPRRLVFVRLSEVGEAQMLTDCVDATIRQLLQGSAATAEEVGLGIHLVCYRGLRAAGSPEGPALWARDIAGAVAFLDSLAPWVAIPELALEREG